MSSEIQEFSGEALDEAIQAFTREPLTKGVFLNTIPKAGTHLLRNILLMFVPTEQTFSSDFVVLENLSQLLPAFAEGTSYFSWGHLAFSEFTAPVLRHVRKIVLVRDPYDYVLSQARFLLSGHLVDKFAKYICDVQLTPEEVMRIVIFGVFGPHDYPGIQDVYFKNALAWMGQGVHVVRFEDLRRHLRDLTSTEADVFFTGLFDAAGIAKADNWIERVRIGAQPRLSATSRLYVAPSQELPDKLGPLERAMVDCAAPGLRTFLGYGDY